MRNLYHKIKELLFSLYLFPANGNAKLAFSLINRVILNGLHLKALIFTIRRLTKGKNDGAIILDVGCFNGSTSIFLHKHFKNSKVIGFEAGKRSFQKALEKTSGISQIKIENYAVSDFCGVAEFFITDNKVSSSLNPLTGSDSHFITESVETVNTITLDEYFVREGLQNENVLALKLDVQGHETQVLKGASATLKRTLFVLTEMSNHTSYKDGAKYHESDQILRENGFVLQNIFACYSYEKYLYEFDAIYINKNLL